jgi:hypothetical protein
MRQWLAGEVRCPLCGEGFRDVAPDYPLAQDPDVWGLAQGRTTWVSGACRGGHALRVTVEQDDTPPTVTASPGAVS